VVEVTMIREGHEFEDLDYLNEEKKVEKLKYAKGNFMHWPYKDIILKTHFSPIVSPQSKEDEDAPTSNILLRSQEPPSDVLKEKDVEVPPKQQEPPQQQELLVSTTRDLLLLLNIIVHSSKSSWPALLEGLLLEREAI
jgi:hypothetical protein